MKINKSTIISNIILILLSFAFLIPLLLLISSSLSSDEEIVKYGLGLFARKPILNAYRLVFQKAESLIRAFKVSVLITVFGTVLNVIFTVMTAYPLTRSNFRLRRQLSFYLYFTMLFNGGLIPTYILITKYLHLQNNLAVLILPSLMAPGTVFLMRTYLYDIPQSIIEAAKIDGASEFQILKKIIFPMSVTPIAIIGFQMAIGYWNEWYNAMLYINKPQLWPLQTFLQNITSYVNLIKNGTISGSMAAQLAAIPSNAIISATCFIVIAPIILVFLLFQRFFVASISVGAVKE